MTAMQTTLCQHIYDPFLGSGTTIIAAENLGRQCRAVEISPGYVAVALERYQATFGIEPELVE
jgi:DNA modification methylase